MSINLTQHSLMKKVTERLNGRYDQFQLGNRIK